MITEEQCFEGDREAIQAQITEHALNMIVRYLTQS
jgi:nicotinamide mononucleotide (NMN) deamidase PncC